MIRTGRFGMRAGCLSGGEQMNVRLRSMRNHGAVARRLAVPFVVATLLAAAGAQAAPVRLICSTGGEGRVFLNGVEIDRCPGTLDLPPGNYSVTVQFDAGGSWSGGEITVANLPVTLFPRPGSGAPARAEPANVRPAAAPAAPPPAPRAEPAIAREDPPPPLPPAPVVPFEAALPPDAGRNADSEISEQEYWYRPTTTDERLRWNAHDPWGRGAKSTRAGFTFGYHSVPAISSNPVAFETGIRVDSESLGLLIASDLFSGALSTGISFGRHWGFALYDNGIPDFSIGILPFSLDLGAALVIPPGGLPDLRSLRAVASIVGGRFVWADFLAVEARPTVGAWVGPFGFSLGYGLSIDAGIVF